MMRSAATAIIAALFLCSCASAPAKKPAKETSAPPPENTKTAPPPKASEEPTPLVRPAEPRPKLGPGQCVDSFDCVDTVGFPPPGHRWNCVERKCTRAKLPSLGGVPEGTTAEATPPSDETKAPAKKRKTRHR
jgi:hypothetical protein